MGDDVVNGGGRATGFHTPSLSSRFFDDDSPCAGDRLRLFDVGDMVGDKDDAMTKGDRLLLLLLLLGRGFFCKAHSVLCRLVARTAAVRTGEEVAEERGGDDDSKSIGDDGDEGGVERNMMRILYRSKGWMWTTTMRTCQCWNLYV